MVVAEMLDRPEFRDEASAREWLEGVLWPDGPVCPHCNATGPAVRRLAGKVHRAGLFQCYGCRKQFTVTVGTILGWTKLPLHVALKALCLLTDPEITGYRVAAALGIPHISAYGMIRRVRERSGVDSDGARQINQAVSRLVSAA